MVDILYDNMKQSLQIARIPYGNRLDVYKKGLLLPEYAEFMKAFQKAFSDSCDPLTSAKFGTELDDIHDKFSNLRHKYVYIKQCTFISPAQKRMVASIYEKLNLNHDNHQ